MSTPASRPGQGAQAQAQQPPQTQQAAQNPAGQAAQQAQPSRPSPASRVAQAVKKSSTPTQMRWARGLATIAAALSGIVATGTFGTDGVNATPNVIAQQWAASEQAGVELAHGGAEAVESVALRISGTAPDAEGSLDPTGRLSTAAGWHARSTSSDGVRAHSTAEAITKAAVLARQAQDQAGSDVAAATSTTQAARVELATAREGNASITEQRVTELTSGSRSALTATVGGLTTLILVLVMVWLALRTRRIVNIPLLVATLITAGLTYLSFNPSALPVNFDQRIGEATRTAEALREAYDARAAQYATALGLDDVDLDPVRNQAQRSIAAVGDPTARDAWRAVDDALQDLPTETGPAVTAIQGTQADWDRLTSTLTSQLDSTLSDAGSQIGTPASITSGAALLLGLIAAALAWTGITQRLRDYR